MTTHHARRWAAACALAASCIPLLLGAQATTSVSWRTDAAFLVRELPRLHAAPWQHTTQATFDSAAAVLLRHDDALPLHRAALEMARLVALIGNGHTELQLFSGPNAVSRLPVRLYRFGDTLRVLVASAEYRDLLGARVVRFGAMPVVDALRRIEPYLARDNPMEFMHQAPTTLASPEVLHALGATPRSDSAEVTFALEEGGEVRRVLPGVSALLMPESRLRGVPRPWSAANPQRWQWWTMRSVEGLGYLRIDASANIDGQPTVAAVVEEFFHAVDSVRPPVIVIDVRDNTGGNNYRNQPLVEAIRARPLYAKRGALFVITGRATFSAGTQLVRDLLRVADPIIVGERSRGDPRQTGNKETFQLPTSGFEVDYSEQLEVQDNGPSPYLPLDIVAPPTFAAMIAGRDPAVEAITARSRSRNRSLPAAGPARR